MHGRSMCMRCGHSLGALDLVPILSYAFLRGRCRYCSVRISPQYPLVEAAAAALSMGVFALNPEPLSFAFWFVTWLVLLFVVVYDLRHTIIPWSCSGLLALLGIAHVLAGPAPISAVALFSGPALAAPLLLLSLVSGGRWMGWGDGALELGIGWLLGATLGLTAFIFAFWSGAVVGIVLLWLSKGYTIKSELPFAPFLILGAGVAYFFHVDIFASLPALFL